MEQLKLETYIIVLVISMLVIYSLLAQKWIILGILIAAGIWKLIEDKKEQA